MTDLSAAGPSIDLLVEGRVDAAFARRLVSHCGGQPGREYGGQGINYLLSRAAGFVRAATPQRRLLVLADFMDLKVPCAVAGLEKLNVEASPSACVRLVVREIESWVMADVQAVSEWLSVPVIRLPEAPDDVDDPKRTFLAIVRRSRKRRLAEELVHATREREGRLYAKNMAGFAMRDWSPERAAERSPSLARAIQRVRELTAR